MKQKSLLRSMLLLFALIVGSSVAWAADTYTRITSTEDLEADGQYIIVCESNYNKAMGALNGTNGSCIAVTISNGTISSLPSDVDVFTLGGSSGAWTLYSSKASKYLTATAAKKLATSSTAASWTISFSGINAVITYSTSSYGSIQYNYNNGNDRFLNYASSQTPICLYKKTTVPSTEWTVTYKANGADSGSVPTDGNTYSASSNTVTVLGNTGNLVKSHYTFGGWNTKADGTGTNYTAGSTFTISASTTLYAKWILNTHNVTLPAANDYGSYTMSSTNPVAYGTEVTLTYTPATGYENYAATWSVNDEPIVENKFTMPDEDVTVTVSVEKVTTVDMTIDFENSVSNYTDWTFTSITGKESGSGVTAHGDSYYGITGTGNGASTASIKTNEKVNPVSLTCYVSKRTTNTTSSTWYIQVSEDGEEWTDVTSVDGASMNKGDWRELTADLSTYTDVYVRVYYSGSTAVRCIDDLVLTVKSGDGPSIEANAVVNIVCEATSGEIAYNILNPIDGTSLTAAEKTDVDWISNVAVDATNKKVTFTTTANTGAARSAVITLTYGEVTKDVTVTQAMYVVTTTYKLATEVVPGRHYIIVGEKDGNYKALGSQTSNNRAAVDITVANNQANITSDLGVHELLLGIDETGYFTFFDESTDAENTGYLYAASSDKNYLRTQATNDVNGEWTISFEGNVAVVQAPGSSNRNVMRYNSSNKLFSCYASSTNESDIYLFERDGDTGNQNFTASIDARCNDGKGKYYGTYSAPFAFIVPSDVTVSEISVSGGILSVTNYEEGATIPANTGVMISSTTAGNKTFTSAKGGTSALGTDNYLRPTYWGISAIEMEEDGSYWYYRLTMHGADFQNNIPGTIGFWWGAAEGAAFAIAANKAYLAVPSGSGAPAMGFGFDDATTNIQNIERTINDNQYYTLDGRRVAQPTKGLYILNGRKVVVK